MEHYINIEATGYPNIIQRINNDFNELQYLDTEYCCIFRVHDGLRKVRPEAYEPMVISIGPYHLQNPRLQTMKKQKLYCLHSLLQRKKDKSVERYVVELAKLEDSVRRCYAESIDLNSEKFVEMMLLDACFIIEFFRAKRTLNPIMDVEWMKRQIFCDLMLLENQLPFFLLSHFYDFTEKDLDDPNYKPNDSPEAPDLNSNTDNGLEDPNHGPISNSEDPNDDPTNDDPNHDPNNNPEDPNCNPTCNNSFMGTAVSYFLGEIPEPFRNSEIVKPCDPREIKHLLHLVHVICHPSSQSRSSRNAMNRIKHLLHPLRNLCRSLLKRKSSELIFKEAFHELYNGRMLSAVELEEAGVKFKKLVDDKLFGIKFEDGLMEVPYFPVKDYTDTFFRNLVAFEQHSSHVEYKYFTDFASFMNQLINTEKDVKLLRHEGIIENYLGDDEEVANLFNKLADGIRVSERPESNYLGVRVKVIKRCKKSWYRARAKLSRDYFNSPWAGISTFAAFTLLVLTIIQTVNSFN